MGGLPGRQRLHRRPGGCSGLSHHRQRQLAVADQSRSQPRDQPILAGVSLPEHSRLVQLERPLHLYVGAKGIRPGRNLPDRRRQRHHHARHQPGKRAAAGRHGESEPGVHAHQKVEYRQQHGVLQRADSRRGHVRPIEPRGADATDYLQLPGRADHFERHHAELSMGQNGGPFRRVSLFGPLHRFHGNRQRRVGSGAADRHPERHQFRCAAAPRATVDGAIER